MPLPSKLPTIGVSKPGLCLGLLLVAGAFLRFYNLGGSIFYWDEPLHCVRIAAQPLPFVLAHNDASAFFALIVHLLLPLGKLEVMARLASFLFGLSGIAAVYFLGKQMFTQREGLIAASLFTFSPLLIRYSQYSRAYSVYVFFSLLSLYFFIKATEENRTRDWALYTSFMTLNIYNHLFAFFTLPVFGTYSGILWLRGLFEKRKKGGRNPGAQILLRFSFWTLLVLTLAVLLYLPDQGAREFISASIDKATTEGTEGARFIFPFQTILKNLVAPRNSLFYFAFVLIVCIGLLATLKKKIGLAILSLLYMIFPFLLFFLIRPSQAHMLSVWRYLLFVLPLLFLLFSQGIVRITSPLSLGISRIKPVVSRKDFVQKFSILFILFIFIFFGFNHKRFYLDFWRTSSLKINKEVRIFLENNIRQDAFVFFDFFPASSMIMIANPLTRDLKVEEIELPIREKDLILPARKRLLVYRVSKEILSWYIHKDIDLWALTSSDKTQSHNLQVKAETVPGTNLTRIDGHTILHFKQNQTPFWWKFIRMSEILLSQEVSPQKEKVYHLDAARVHLLAQNFEESIHHLDEARSISPPSFDAAACEKPFVFRVLDHLFALKPDDIYQTSLQKLLFEDITALLLAQGDLFRQGGDQTNALRAYQECTKLSREFDLVVSNRLAQIANRLSNAEKSEEAIPFLKEAARLNPERADLRFFLGECYRKTGHATSALEEYTRTFSADSFSLPVINKLLDSDPLLIVWKKNSTWHLLFRSEKRTNFSGRISAAGRIRDMERQGFAKNDLLTMSKKDIRFQFDLDGGEIKTVAVKTNKKGSLSVDLRMNGRKIPQDILILREGSSPQSIPFVLK